MKTPPLSLYVHIPWCVQKCPYCDFNSVGQKAAIDYHQYIQALLQDLSVDLTTYHLNHAQRKLHSIFIGGGTPSLFPAKFIKNLIEGIKKLIEFESDIEITMEANPGTFEAERFVGYKTAGITRMSIGVQSFNDEKLHSLGRIHSSQEAKVAINKATSLFERTNIDLMHGLPNQSVHEALDDLKQAIALNPQHLSWYQLTIEPNTVFGYNPPTLPNENILWSIFEQGNELLTQAGYVQYETSGYSKPDFQCQHNLNYWRFGDYLGIGCGAHGKITVQNHIIRTQKLKKPKGYLNPQQDFLANSRKVTLEEQPFEFFMNRFRLLEPCPKQDFLDYTDAKLAAIQTPIQAAIDKNLIQDRDNTWQITNHGKLFLNDLLTLFL